MKTILIVLTVLLSYSTQAQVTPPKKASKIVQVLDSNAFTTTYKLYETQNMWTFIKLNTRNGLMWIVQYSTEDSSRFEVYLNLLPLIEKDKEVVRLQRKLNFWGQKLRESSC